MISTTRCIGKMMAPRHIVAALLAFILSPASVLAQEADWRTPYAAAEAAREAQDHETYAREMAAAVAAMPAAHLNRPFAQYHAARAFALLGDAEQSARFLELAWDEDIEKLMISFAEHDDAFDDVRDHEAYREVMARAAQMEISVTPLAGGVHLLGGAGSSVVASVGDDGVLLVDTGYRAALPALRRALATLGASEVARVILTHPHEDHWGMAPDLGEEAEIRAHPGTTEAMAEPYTFIDGVVLDAKPREAWPDLDVTEGSFWFNGEDVVVFEVSAHTGADLAVYFAGSGVLHMGDAYLGGNPMMFPGGADPDGFLGRLESRLAAMDERTIVVGGHDSPVGLDELRAQIRETRSCMNLVRRAMADGKTLEDTVASAGDRFAPQWVGYFYRLFSAE